MTTPAKGKADYLALGDYNAVCYECGRKFKASELIKHWQGYFVCREHWESRHPQDFVRGVKEQITPPWTQPMPADTFAQFITANGMSAVPGQAEPDGLVPGYLSPFYNSEAI